MAETPAEALEVPGKRDWRRYETRQRPKLLAKRVSNDEHAVIDWYSKEVNRPVSELLEPAVAALIATARAALAAKEQAGDPLAAEIALTLASA
ncbi:Uncharacterised protein [Mycobacteroides abscessus subsp. abscessus]|uniref:hypothetical protein n=1 Tax=Mycobacteroides abscessus TaxID=36809 RepID=UPI0009A7A3C9|nr:hypothetical protein [Mycobacteroides abscessus]SLI00717.1 Uncharacterised protein [Mycobacteroides abscessus subsp. abscessus]